MGVMATRDSIQVKSQDERLPYRLREKFMSAPELALFRSLQNMAGKHYVVCPKVALNDIFYIVRPNENVHFFNKIFRKHVDFLLCDPKTLQPVFGIELVKPVGKSETREADQFLEDLFLSAGLPLVHVISSETYSEEDLAELFQLAIVKVKQSRPLRATGRSDSVPHCPICGKMMVLRMHRTGPDKGKRYYGCMDNPRCSGAVRID
ncbi:MAG: topoisomerase [Anaerolineae bacterium]|nr:MAG: topoisomerase [Anaerolineae bacterium]